MYTECNSQSFQIARSKTTEAQKWTTILLYISYVTLNYNVLLYTLYRNKIISVPADI